MKEVTYSLPTPGGDPNDFVERTFRQNELFKSDEKVAATVLNNWALVLADRSFFAEAAAALRRATALDPSPRFFLNLSVVYDRLKMYKEAEESAAKGVEMAPDDNVLRGRLCVSLLYTSEFPAAAACFDTLRSFTPLDDYFSTAYGIALLHSGRSDEAIETLQAIVDRSPDNYAAMNALGMAHFLRKDLARAGEIFKEAVETAPEQGQARFNLAIVQLMQRNRAGALSQYKLLQEHNPRIADKLSRVLFRDKVVYVEDK